MPEKEASINLLPQKNHGFIAQFLDWALTIGRLLIILTEMVALGTFVFRFALDAQLVDLHDKIKGESFILVNFQDGETTFRDIQARLAAAKQYTAVANTTGNTFNDILKMGQGKITFDDLTVSTQTVTISLQAPTGALITQFVNALKSYPQITSVVVDKVDSDPTDAAITISLTATLKPAPFSLDASQIDSGNNTTQTTGGNQ
jgi:hypothetical protein